MYIEHINKHCISHIHLPPASMCQAFGNFVLLESPEVKPGAFWVWYSAISKLWRKMRDTPTYILQIEKQRSENVHHLLQMKEIEKHRPRGKSQVSVSRAGLGLEASTWEWSWKVQTLWKRIRHRCSSVISLWTLAIRPIWRKMLEKIILWLDTDNDFFQGGV